MKAIDIVNQLLVKLPQLTDKFTDDVSVSDIIRSGTLMTATCNAPHGLEVGEAVVINGAVPPISCSITRAGAVGTVVTDTDHDLTNPVAETIKLSGSVESEFNGTFARLQVKNRRTISFTMIDAGPVTATGSPVLENAESFLRSYKETVQVIGTPNPAQFTYLHAVTSLPDPIGQIIARTRPRITAGINFQRCVAAYTEQPFSKYWLFVVLGDVTASKSRRVGSDAIDNINRGHYVRQQLIQPVSLYVFANVGTELLARTTRDEMEDLFRPICRSVLHKKFDSGLYGSDEGGALQFFQHGVANYDTTVLTYAFEFQQVVDLYFEDTVGPDDDVAFRDIDFKAFPDPDKIGTTISFMQGTPDLDDEPLP